ncbi:hypothetical protein BDD43_0554 [Mucilaginibacter gracilis]|uniref:Uncharacterized protein n=2 Tax=Mucilaginibacter TaxID=423349 RepID=H1YI71_9SPHI|nr:MULTISPECIES: hypothetical protein [Mucilaginibacter]EHQ26506.1 hypothetical protein Mucpa_2376 [Mucilaginibacter paludis DSM 18603]RKR80445.1 hypothetical protein BDD43_0554 [Mucilaginibacter gracilis]
MSIFYLQSLHFYLQSKFPTLKYLEVISLNNVDNIIGIKMQTPFYTLLIAFTFSTACGQKQTAPNKDIKKSETKDTRPSTDSNEKYHAKYVYTDATGKHLIIQNSFPKGGPYTDPNGKKYFRIIFWTRLINETDESLELNIDFPADPYEVPGFPGKYHRVLIPPDTMTINKEAMYDYGLAGLKSFLDNSIHKPSSLKRIISPKASSGFYVVILSQTTQGALSGVLRAGLSLKGHDLYYSIKIDGSKNNAGSSDKEIHCGSINLKNLMLQN